MCVCVTKNVNVPKKTVSSNRYKNVTHLSSGRYFLTNVDLNITFPMATKTYGNISYFHFFVFFVTLIYSINSSNLCRFCKSVAENTGSFCLLGNTALLIHEWTHQFSAIDGNVSKIEHTIVVVLFSYTASHHTKSTETSRIT